MALFCSVLSGVTQLSLHHYPALNLRSAYLRDDIHSERQEESDLVFCT